MINKLKLISELEDVVYSYYDKYVGDDIVTKYTNLFNLANFDDYKLSWKFSPIIELIVKHKAFSNKVRIYIDDSKLFIENKEIKDLNDLNDILPTFFIITLDKKEKEE